MTAFPNYTQIPTRVSVGTWQAIRVVTLLGAIALALALVVVPDTGLFVLWRLIIPVLPLLWLVVPGLWRNICPLSASNQTPRVLGLSKGRTAPAWLKEYGFVIAAAMFIAFVSLRKVGLDDSGPASALLLLLALSGGFVGGIAFKGKSGWCSSICPLLPIQRLYGQTPYKLVANSHCTPCVGCTKSCYDFNPKAAWLADLHDQDAYWAGYRKLFAAAFPGLVLAFFNLPEARGADAILELYATLGLYLAASVAVFFTLDSLLKVSTHKVTTLFAATGFSLFYWYGGPVFVDAVLGSTPEGAKWAVRVAAIALAGGWVLRTYAKERAFHAQAAPAAPAAPVADLAAAGRSMASHRALNAGAPEVSFEPEGKRVVAKPGMSLLEAAEAGGLPIESGCRMGVCGADPVCVKDGMENLSAISDDERSTLDRLGLADNTRMACCARVQGPVTMSLTPEKPQKPSVSRIAQFAFDRSVERVVVLGNGIAGVTAADHVRRRHPLAQIDLVAEESHPLYNRMGIARLIYGRSAMQGLYLNPEAWYEEHGITPWLNTRARGVNRADGHVRLGTGEKLPYDRLIIATGSSSFVPEIEGFGVPGSFVLRTADDALGLRSFAQREGARHAVVAGGGLLGLEAAYALHKLGLRTTVLERGDRLLRRQLDARASALLQAYLEGLGLEVLTDAETVGLSANGRVRSAHLADARALPADVFLAAAGIEPNIGLARDAGLAINRGVLVDERMRTSDPTILAAGDVAEHAGRVHGLWPVAVEQAEVAADNAVGGDKHYRGTIPFTILKVVGVELTSVGRFEQQAGDQVVALEEPGGRYRKLVIEDGRIVGAILLGYSSQDVAAVRTAINRGLDVGGVMDALHAGRWNVLEAEARSAAPRPRSTSAPPRP
ncbi:MAG TPA: FAD-dependent oxidoreductase [Solirubrobacteraceae bacterium]|nr:FAD-dependent oxidoreductase [Solirubrobacteraceae bacterium]